MVSSRCSLNSHLRCWSFSHHSIALPWTHAPALRNALRTARIAQEASSSHPTLRDEGDYGLNIAHPKGFVGKTIALGQVFVGACFLILAAESGVLNSFR